MMKKLRMTGLDQWVGPSCDVQVLMFRRGIVELNQKNMGKEGLLLLPNKVMKNIMIVIPIGQTQAIIHISMIKTVMCCFIFLWFVEK